MTSLRSVIEALRGRSDVVVVDESEVWRIVITRGRDLACEVVVPHYVLEWHASVIDRHQKRELWSDWLDYSGYDDRSREELESEMARDVLAFVDRASTSEPLLPIRIHEA